MARKFLRGCLSSICIYPPYQVGYIKSQIVETGMQIYPEWSVKFVERFLMFQKYNLIKHSI